MCAYVCVYVCVYVHAYVYVCISVYVCICLCICVHVCMCVHVCVCIYVCIMCVHICMRVCMYVFMHVTVLICLHEFWGYELLFPCWCSEYSLPLHRLFSPRDLQSLWGLWLSRSCQLSQQQLLCLAATRQAHLPGIGDTAGCIRTLRERQQGGTKSIRNASLFQIFY